MSTVRVSARKDVRQEARILRRLGFEFTGHDSKTHPVFTHPAYGTIRLPETPKPGGRWQARHRGDLARLMGITPAELEARIADQATVGKRSADRPRRRRGRRGRAPHALRHAQRIEPAAGPVPALMVVPAPKDHTGPITPARRDRWAVLAADLERRNALERLNARRAA